MKNAVFLVLAYSSPILALSLNSQQEQECKSEPYLSWSATHAETVGRSMYAKGRVGGIWDSRLLKTDRSYNYKLAATWLTPEVIQASARLAQLAGRLTAEETCALVAEGEAVGDTVIMVEMDPREGSGVIPNDWKAFLQPRAKGAGTDTSEFSVTGITKPGLREIRALAGVLRRNYDYDRFWVVFPLTTKSGRAIFSESTDDAELTVRVHNQEGRVSWRIPDSIRNRMAERTMANKAAKSASGYAYVLTEIEEDKDKGAGLVGLNLNSGEVEHRVLLKMKEPDYDVDELEGRIFNVKDKKEITAYSVR